MPTSHPPPDSPATEELVAYLDGELSPDDSRRVERRLASDAEYRRQLAALEQAWLALEELPRAVVADDFARTTIEMVTVAAKRDAGAQSTTRAMTGRRRTALVAAVGLACAAAAFAAVRTLVPSRNGALIDNLPVIAQLDVLQQVVDIETLRGLTKLDLPPLAENDRAASFATATDNWKTFDDRRAWINELPAEKKAELAGKFDRFERLSPAPAAQDRLRAFERAISESLDRAKLQQTLSKYAAWIQGRTPGEQMELRELSTAERLRRVEMLIQQAGRRLSPTDEAALQKAILEFVAERRDQLLEEVRQPGNRNAQRRIGERPAGMVALVLIEREMRDEEGRRRLQDRLTAELSPEAQEYFDRLEGRQRAWQLRQWTMDALRPKFGPQELERFFAEELDNDRREYLLGLPQAEMEVQLKQWYMSSQVGLRGQDWPGRFGRGGPGRGPGDHGWRGGPRQEFEGRGFEGGPFPRGPAGPRPEGPPPGNGHRRGPPPPHEFGPPPEEPI